MNKAKAQHKNTIRRGPYDNSPITHRARKKIIKNTPEKKEIIPNILISLVRIRFQLIRTMSQQQSSRHWHIDHGSETNLLLIRHLVKLF